MGMVLFFLVARRVPVDQTAHPPVFRTPVARAASSGQEFSTGWRGDALSPLQSNPTAAGSVNTPLAGPAAVGSSSQAAASQTVKTGVMATLRQAIARIERPPQLEAAAPDAAGTPWRLGCPKADRLLPGGLDDSGVHELKAAAALSQGASAADWMTGIGFALRLAVCRLKALEQAQAAQGAETARERPWLMWCWPRVLSRELGAPSALGLKHLGLDPDRLIIVETARDAEALIALEEGLRSSSLALAFGLFEAVELTPSRRLSLAAHEHHTPCLIITHPGREPAAAAATRWRIGRSPSAPHPLVPRAPGSMRFSAVLERCRARPASSACPPLQLEWSDETRGFCHISDVADRPAAPRRALGGAC